MESIGDLAGSVCTGCFTGITPMEVPKEASRHLFENDRGGKMKEGFTYRDAGVDVQAGYRAVEKMKAHVRSTATPGVLSPPGFLWRALPAGCGGVSRAHIGIGNRWGRYQAEDRLYDRCSQ